MSDVVSRVDNLAGVVVSVPVPVCIVVDVVGVCVELTSNSHLSLADQERAAAACRRLRVGHLICPVSSTVPFPIQVLTVLADADLRPLSVGEVASELQVSSQQVSRVLSDLLSVGLVRRVLDKNDRRLRLFRVDYAGCLPEAVCCGLCPAGVDC